MPSAYVLLRCIGKAVVKNVVNLFTFGVGGDILVDAWEYWNAATREEERPRQVEAVAAIPAAELREEVARIVREEAAALLPEQQGQVAAYLGQVPAMVRRSLRRPSDPSGRTTAAGTVFRKPDDLAPLLPAGLPRFKAGDRPLAGVDWELVELLGVGGFGEVWKARNPQFDGRPPVALKFCLDPAAKARLLTHEAKIISQVMQHGKHEGIVPLLHTYLSADPPCLEYEYVEGGDLAGVIQGRRDGLKAPQAAHVIRRLAEIVGFAHRLSPPVVHRDLKPANVLVKPRPGGKLGLRITDFGIGGLAIQQAVAQSRRSSKHGEFLTAAVRGSYTPLYGSPQQMRGEDPDPRDDVYALGVIWHQLLTGDLMTGRPGGEAWKRRLTERGMTPALLALLASSFEDRREDRPANAVELGEKLGRLLQVPAPAPSAYPEAIPLLDALPPKAPKAPSPPPRPERPPAPKVEQPRRVEVPKEGPRRRIEAANRELQHSGERRRSWAIVLVPVGVLLLALLIVGGLCWMTASPRTQGPGELSGEGVITNSIGMKLKLIKAGAFMMGSPNSDKDAQDDEKPRHEVAITRPFYLGAYPVTKAQFAAFVSGDGYKTEAELAGETLTWRSPGFGQTDDDPVVRVSWNDAVKFCAWLSEKEKKTYGLPTEAQWEYACRAGTTTAYSFGDDPKMLGDYAWYGDNSGSNTHPVGTKKPNPWGLYDMHGNVLEWCADYYDPKYYQNSPNKDQNILEAPARVCRGGSWIDNPRFCRSAYRCRSAPACRTIIFGLRVCLLLD